ncbi:MAG: sigma-70 family RNA polymerase sigma factor [Phycisphaerales bacterium]|nr:sigma-70 family RNA polymerase sigma factor [Phycisphaerales bacterium]MCB9854557.1 sigma-70 family RNA polymerase sigma factor [Phycisphaerales bacterium]MCB9863212.1 sigma-70 family RNA polymerase sigma factor [Phycisphaerales bacterium]
MIEPAGPNDDPELLSRAIAGEPLALDRLLLDHHRALKSVVEKKLPPTLASVVSAEDILQECYTEAYRDIGKFRPDGPNALFRWLCTIADHRLLDTLRAHRAAKRGGGRAAVSAGTDQQHSAALALLDVVFAHTHTPSRSVAGHEASAAVKAAIDTLKPEYRDAIRLRYIEGRSVGETAAIMGKSERSVHKLCSRGIQRLRDALGNASRFFSES